MFPYGLQHLWAWETVHADQQDKLDTETPSADDQMQIQVVNEVELSREKVLPESDKSSQSLSMDSSQSSEQHSQPLFTQELSPPGTQLRTEDNQQRSNQEIHYPGTRITKT